VRGRIFAGIVTGLTTGPSPLPASTELAEVSSPSTRDRVFKTPHLLVPSLRYSGERVRVKGWN
jgi:hypothetical protein